MTHTYEVDKFIRMQKLTLSVDAGVVARAKRYAESRGTSVSRIVETMLHMVSTKGSDGKPAPPVLAKLRGSLAKGSSADYRKYLAKKYK